MHMHTLRAYQAKWMHNITVQVFIRPRGAPLIHKFRGGVFFGCNAVQLEGGTWGEALI